MNYTASSKFDTTPRRRNGTKGTLCFLVYLLVLYPMIQNVPTIKKPKDSILINSMYPKIIPRYNIRTVSPFPIASLDMILNPIILHPINIPMIRSINETCGPKHNIAIVRIIPNNKSIVKIRLLLMSRTLKKARYTMIKLVHTFTLLVLSHYFFHIAYNMSYQRIHRTLESILLYVLIHCIVLIYDTVLRHL